MSGLTDAKIISYKDGLSHKPAGNTERDLNTYIYKNLIINVVPTTKFIQ